LPLRLFWSSADRGFDLADPDMARCLYETVLREATRPGDLAAYLDSGMLVRIWPRLFLPRGRPPGLGGCPPGPRVRADRAWRR
jgi:hypothetical protein